MGASQKAELTKREAEEFLRKHGTVVENEAKGYRLSMNFYCLYLADCMEQAEAIEDGLSFDELEVSILLHNLEEAKAAMEYYRKKLHLDVSIFDAAETISLKGCRLENGRIIGDVEAAEEIARMWIKNYFRSGGNAFMLEVGVYILFLLHQDYELH